MSSCFFCRSRCCCSRDAFAGRPELVRLPVGDGGVQVAVPDAGNAGRQGVQGLRDVAEEVPGQVVVGPRDGQQQCRRHGPGIAAEDGGGVGKQAFDRLPRLVQLLQGDPQLGEIHPLQQGKADPQADEQQHRRCQHRDHEHGDIGPRKALFDGHGHDLPHRIASIIP